jgi:thioesterase domain-containing protein
MPRLRLDCLPPPQITEDAIVTRVPSWVEHHHRQLLTLQPDPPYRLLGWSFGGVIAIELARRLRAEGRPIEFVGLIDSIRPRIRPIRTRDALPYHLREAALIDDPAAQRDYLRREARWRFSRWLGLWAQRLRPDTGTLAGRQGYRKPQDPLLRSIHRSYLNYQAEPIDFPVALFATSDSTERCGEDASLYWSYFFRGGFTVHPIPGDHHTLWEDRHLDVVARRLGMALHRAAKDATISASPRGAGTSNPTPWE